MPKKIGSTENAIRADTSMLEKSFDRLPKLTADEHAALDQIPDDAVTHWCRGEKWDFDKKVWIPTDVTE